MKACTSAVASLLLGLLLFSPASAAPRYWVGSSPNPSPSGDWDTTSAIWNDAADGAGAAVNFNDFDTPTFSAGSGATGSYTVNVIGTVAPDDMFVEEGDITFNGGFIDLFDTIDVAAGASATINASLVADTLSVGTPFIKTGPGRLVLTSANLQPDNNPGLDGTITVSAGTLAIGDNAPATVLGTFPSQNGQNATAPQNTVVSNGATLEITGTFNARDSLLIRGDGVDGGGALRKTGANVTVFNGNLNTQGIKMEGGSARITSATAGGVLEFRAGSFGRSTTTGPPTLTFDGDGDFRTIPNANVGDPPVSNGQNWNIAIGNSRVVKEGTGTLTLGGVSSWTGGITIKGGAVAFSADVNGTGSQQLGAVTAMTPNAIILDGGTIRATNSGTIFTNVNRGIQISENGGNYEPTAGAVLFQSVIGRVPGTTTAVLTKTGTGELRMPVASQVHDFDKLVLKQGLYRIGQATTLGQDTQLGKVPDAPLDDAVTLDGGNFSFGGGEHATVVTTHPNRGFTLNTTGGNIQTDNSSGEILGKISGNGALNKTNAFTLLVGGDNTYGGGTNVNAGRLLVTNTAGSGTGSGAVAVNGSSTLGGTGTISGAVTMNATSRLNPGRPAATGGFISPAAGTLTVGSVGFGSTTFFDVQIGSALSYDKLVVNGAAALTGTLNVSLFDSFQPVLNDTFDILTATGGLGGSEFTTETLPTLTDPNIAWQVNYLANSVQLQVVSANTTTPGDINGDGLVNILDYVVGRMADPPGTGTDLVDWAENYTGALSGSGSGQGGVNAAVPEPSAVALMILGLAAAGFRRRGR